ncbi:MAG: dienelactone hydrolase [Bacteroidia bacterium]
MISNKAFKFKGSDARWITADLSYRSYEHDVPIAVFAHGFKGFKDWGAWPLAAQIFALKGIPFFKFNFSHNGTTPDSLGDFNDLEAFGKNTISKELADLSHVLDFIQENHESFEFNWNGKVHLIGYSRGAASCLLFSVNDERVTSCVSWAGMNDLSSYLELEDPIKWQQEGVCYIDNARTGEKMPIEFGFFEDLVSHKEEYNVMNQIEELKQDLLILHGEKDTVIPHSAADEMYASVGHSILVTIDNANHTFNTSHPLKEKKIPLAFAQMLEETLEFLLM